MRGAVMYAPGDVRVEDRPEPIIQKSSDAVIRLSATCICGSDLWPYRGTDSVGEPIPMGHEYVGIVEEVGPEVTATIWSPLPRRCGSVRRRGFWLTKVPLVEVSRSQYPPSR